MKKLAPVKNIKINKVINEILDYFNDFSFENGGALGIKDNVISSFYPVKNIDSDRRAYSPSFDDLNAALEYFESNGMSFAGIIHSHNISVHGNGCNNPSKQDIDFYRNFAETNSDFAPLLFPIITIIKGEKTITWYQWAGELTQIDVDDIKNTEH